MLSSKNTFLFSKKNVQVKIVKSVYLLDQVPRILNFERLGHLPDPTPSNDDLHYKPFHEVFKTEV